MVDPTPVPNADYLLVESTYGNRIHDSTDAESVLTEVIVRTATRGGTILVPAFAVGRTQSLLYHIYRLKAANRIPDLPVFIDSPMAINASEIFCANLQYHRLTEAECRAMCNAATYVRSVDDSKALNHNTVPKVLISASGMATGGRVLHHLKHVAPDPRNTILLTGFQAAGTRGAALAAGVSSLRIHGQTIWVKADVDMLHMLSAHADAGEIISWLRNFRKPPKMTFVIHGEPAASEALSQRIESELGWPCRIPEHQTSFSLE
jgi:metallo-beta-lactamase family protein